ncbi:phosphotransferase [Aestuariicella hydrocarbonica]|uniref:Phosphotransferase n=1 Tax=Pseudomaricurvus hydrocarbonicus TaxID=1470433 RepID=A0A9E5JPE0_9GAMM|nr:phosphotransferase [Aestuariicella hydrocarbonica]NHO64049.1 phosphotransferase [Aestuariicella hydrocarbonica]
MDIQTLLKDLFNAHQASPCATLQELWSGYGRIVRFKLTDVQGNPCHPASVVVKLIQPPTESNHPRGWNTTRSHQRKLTSYQVEAHWYQHWANHCNNQCKVAHCYGVFEESASNKTCIILEDLDLSGFDLRADDLAQDIDTTLELCRASLRWLARFHASFLVSTGPQSPPAATPQNEEERNGLWPIGTYWHLDTRPDEWERMADSPLKQRARAIDQRLNSCSYTTLVHGDAKVANFCIDSSGTHVAAVDFQYVGYGCGMKDVVYLLGSCLSEHECEHYHQTLLNHYFQALRQAVASNPQLKDTHKDRLEREWRELFAFAWADFHRFILGWSPGHDKNNRFSQKMADEALHQLNYD